MYFLLWHLNCKSSQLTHDLIRTSLNARVKDEIDLFFFFKSIS